MEVLAYALFKLRAMLDPDADYDAILAETPGYDQERFREIERARARAVEKMKARARAKRGRR